MIPPVDLSFIDGELGRLSDELEAAYEDQGGDPDTDPRILLQPLNELIDRLRRPEREGAEIEPKGDEASARATEIADLANQGISLLSRLSALADNLGRASEARAVEGLTLPLACWLARRGGEISDISTAVNAAAALANRLRQPEDLATLYGLLSELVNAASPRLSQDSARAEANRPWRVLLLNRAIVATRSHRPALMEEAFESLVEQLPEDAPEFFREGMGQMEALDYPAQVRRVVERYYEKWCERRVLH